MEIERKYLIPDPPADYQTYPYQQIKQAYLCTEPVVRVRRQDGEYWLTYKSKGLMAREEYNLPLTEDAYHHLLAKADGIVLAKKRYRIPIADEDLTIELDVFDHPYEGLILAEVEFATVQAAQTFCPPGWFGEDVTFSGEYQNSVLSQKKP